MVGLPAGDEVTRKCRQKKLSATRGSDGGGDFWQLHGYRKSDWGRDTIV